MAPRSQAVQLAESSEWSALKRLVIDCPKVANERGEYGMRPIHWACTEPRLPLSVLDQLLLAAPDTVRTRNDAQLLPLHIAIRAKAPYDFLERLVRAYPDALTELTRDGKSTSELAEWVGLPKECRRLLNGCNRTVMVANESTNQSTNEKDDLKDPLVHTDEEDLLASESEMTLLRCQQPASADGDQYGNDSIILLDADWTPLMQSTSGMRPTGESNDLATSTKLDDSFLDWSSELLAECESSFKRDPLISPSSSSSSHSSFSIDSVENHDDNVRKQDQEDTESISAISVLSAPETSSYKKKPFLTTKEMQNTASRKHSLDTKSHLKAAEEATHFQQESLHMQSNQARPNAISSVSRAISAPDGHPKKEPRHRSLPIVPSFHKFRMKEDEYHSLDGIFGADNQDDDKEPQTMSLSDRGRRRRDRVISSFKRSAKSHEGVEEDGNPPVIASSKPMDAAPEWRHDDQCSICSLTFSIFKHRHHCRNCGKSVCKDHSAGKKLPMREKGFTAPQRVCVACYTMLNQKSSKHKEVSSPKEDGVLADMMTDSNPVTSFAKQQERSVQSMRTTSAGAASSHMTSSMPIGFMPRTTTCSSEYSSHFDYPVLRYRSPTSTNQRTRMHCAQDYQPNSCGKPSESCTAGGKTEKSSSDDTPGNIHVELKDMVKRQDDKIERLEKQNANLKAEITRQQETGAETNRLLNQLLSRVSILEQAASMHKNQMNEF